MTNDVVEYLFDKKLRPYENKLIEFFTSIGEQKRVNPKYLKMSAYLIIHKKLTQKQLQELTGFSLGTISTFLSVMLGTGYYEKERIHGTHKYTYRYRGDIEDLTTRGMDNALKSLLQSESFLQKKKEELLKLKKEKKKGAAHLAQRIDELCDIFDVYRELFPNFIETIPREE
ncbi:MAG: hypothetical protein ACFFBP_05310 [Promethearchaeota archaeon]